MSITAIANRYGRALADVAVEKGEHSGVKEELSIFVQMMEESAELRELFSNPTVSPQNQRAVIKAITERAKPSQTTIKFLDVLLDNHRLQHLPEIYKAFVRSLDSRLGVVEAKVTTARPMSEAQQNRLVEKLKKVTGKEVRTQFSVDPTIIGGVITQIGSQIYDGSIRSQLQQLRSRLSRD